MTHTRNVGTTGEDFAAKELEKTGIRILCRNFKGTYGEIDIIAEKEKKILFIEVKLRKMLSQKPSDAVDKEKMQRIILTANEFLRENTDNTYISSLMPSFCVFEVYTDKNGIVTHSFLENVYE